MNILIEKFKQRNEISTIFYIILLFSAWNVLPTFQFHAPDCSSILESGYTLLSYSFDSTA